MKKAFKKLINNLIDKCIYILNILNRISKIAVRTACICFPISIALIIINSIQGVHIRVGYYMLLAIIVTVSITAILVGMNYKKVFAKRKKVSKKTVPTNNKDRATQRRIQRNRRRIS